MANFIRELLREASPCSIDKLHLMLITEEDHLKVVMEKHEAQWQRHLPRNGARKRFCLNCRKKMSEAVCAGCSVIEGREVHLCIGYCHS